jgi:hypothetical protein
MKAQNTCVLMPVWEWLLRTILNECAGEPKTMNLKLEELRKRLLDPSAPNAMLPPDTLYRRSTESPATAHPETPTEVKPERVNSDRDDPKASDSQGGAGVAVQQDGTFPDGGVPPYQLAQAVTRVFESTRLHQETIAELGKSFDLIEQTAQSAARAFEPIRAFREQMEKLASTFAPMRSFQEQLGTLADEFEPMRALHDQITMVAEAFQANLAQLARSMEPAKSFQAQLTKLAQAFETVSQLQSQFIELAETFRVASRNASRSAGVNTPA